MGYDRSVKKSLDGVANVIFPSENCTDAFTKQVLSCVAPALGIDGPVEYREELYGSKPIGI